MMNEQEVKAVLMSAEFRRLLQETSALRQKMYDAYHDTLNVSPSPRPDAHDQIKADKLAAIEALAKFEDALNCSKMRIEGEEFS